MKRKQIRFKYQGARERFAETEALQTNIERYTWGVRKGLVLPFDLSSASHESTLPSIMHLLYELRQNTSGRERVMAESQMARCLIIGFEAEQAIDSIRLITAESKHAIETQLRMNIGDNQGRFIKLTPYDLAEREIVFAHAVSTSRQQIRNNFNLGAERARQTAKDFPPPYSTRLYRVANIYDQAGKKIDEKLSDLSKSAKENIFTWRYASAA